MVTGASRGIGAALASELAARGALLALVARSRADLDKVAVDIGGADVYAADLAAEGVLDSLVAAIAADGPIDALVNNAGVDLAGRLSDLAPDRIAQLIAVNLTAPIVLSRAVIPHMMRQGSGHIVNISSLSGTNSLPGIAPYSASKAGLSHFTAGLRAELRGTPITTTLVQIGPVESEMMDNLREYGPTRRAVQRLGRVRVSYDLPIERVVRAIADAIEDERRHVRLPRRNAIFPMFVEAPRRITEWLLAGVDHQQD